MPPAPRAPHGSAGRLRFIRNSGETPALARALVKESGAG